MVVGDNGGDGEKKKHLSGLAAFQAEASDEEDAFGTAPKLQAFEGATMLSLAAMKAENKTDELEAYIKSGNKLIKEGKIGLIIYGGDRIMYDGSEKPEAGGMADTGLPSKKSPY